MLKLISKVGTLYLLENLNKTFAISAELSTCVAQAFGVVTSAEIGLELRDAKTNSKTKVP
jgi:hypothetical protein